MLKKIIKNTKMNAKAAPSIGADNSAYAVPVLSRSAQTPDTYMEEDQTQTRETSLEPQCLPEHDFTQFHSQDPFDPLSSQLHTPHLDSNSYWSSAAPYEVDIKTESELFVNDVSTRRDSSTSSFSTFQPPLAHVMLPPFPGDEWPQREIIESQKGAFSFKETPDYNLFEFTHTPANTSSITIDDGDRHLLDQFFEKVLPLIFPVLDVRQPGAVRSEVILPAIESNKCYLHCCLSNTAVQLKALERLSGEQIDNDILRHRYQTISELCNALNKDTDHVQILEASLAMIFFQCAVGRPDDTLPDIPWHQHFQAATSLIHKLDLPQRLVETDQINIRPPFNMSLAAWIDILGSTMIGQMPQFAHTYRTKLFSGSGSGLCELMGCEDRVMYLISEISCLDALKLEGRLDHLELCGHITTLAKQLDYAEPQQGSLIDPCSEDGVIDPAQLAKNITALFCVAARIYLCSLVPGFHRTQRSTINLVSHATEILNLIPGGPDGFDRALVWPLLICGSNSIPNSTFRCVLGQRIERMGEDAEMGSFGRMIQLLKEVWRIADELSVPAEGSESGSESESAPMTTNVVVETEFLPTPGRSGASTPERTQKIKAEDEDEQEEKKLLLPPSIPEPSSSSSPSVLWRDIMRQNGWDFLFM